MTGTGSPAPVGTTEDLLPRRQGETVLITGASSGIGRELARLFASDGADLVLIARSEGRLRELAGELAATYGTRAQVMPADLSRPASPDEIAEELARRHIHGMRRGRTLVIPGLRNRVLAFSVRLAPRVLAARAAGRLLA